jgi:outer membrane cobalamin receptor
MSEPVGKATVEINGMKFKDVDVYSYHDSETNTNYRSIFISDLDMDRSFQSLPSTANVKYMGRRYTAMKFGNPNNKIPTYDFTVENKV